jgi:transposase InsO family protein
MDMSKVKRSGGYTRLSYQEKVVALKHYFVNGVTAADIGRMTGASPNTVYDWLKKIDYDFDNIERLKPKNRNRSTRKNLLNELAPWVTDEISELLKKNPFMGPLKIKQYFFRHHQIIVPEKRIYFYLKEKGIINKRMRRKKSSKKHERRFEYDRPLAAVQMDLMQLKLTGNKKAYLISIIDDYSRFMLASKLVPDKTMESVITVFSDMIKKYGVVERVITDKGSEFVSWQSFTKFEELLCTLDIELIASGPDKPQCQGKIERWHGTLRKEFQQVYGCFDFSVQAQLELDDFVNYYNYERPHQAINGLVPADRLYGLQKELETVLEECEEDQTKQIYFSCNINGEKIVISGPRSQEVKIYRSQVENQK